MVNDDDVHSNRTVDGKDTMAAAAAAAAPGAHGSATTATAAAAAAAKRRRKTATAAATPSLTSANTSIATPHVQQELLLLPLNNNSGRHPIVDAGGPASASASASASARGGRGCTRFQPLRPKRALRPEWIAKHSGARGGGVAPNSIRSFSSHSPSGMVCFNHNSTIFVCRPGVVGPVDAIEVKGGRPVTSLLPPTTSLIVNSRTLSGCTDPP